MEKNNYQKNWNGNRFMLNFIVENNNSQALTKLNKGLKVFNSIATINKHDK